MWPPLPPPHRWLLLLLLPAVVVRGQGYRRPTISFITQPEIVEDIGATATMRCDIQYAGDYPVIWMKLDPLDGNNDLAISSGSTLILHDPRFQIYHYDDVYKLVIQDIQETDAAKYQCQVIISLTDKETAEVPLIIRRPPIIRRPSPTTHRPTTQRPTRRTTQRPTRRTTTQRPSTRRPPADPCYCPDGWFGPINCYCYSGIAIGFRSWRSARKACQALNSAGDLVSIHSPAENELVQQIKFNMELSTVPTYGSGGKPAIWIGLSDGSVEGSWVWSDGTLPAYVNWDINQPDNRRNQDCAVMWKDAGKWDDSGCSHNETAAAICKMPAKQNESDPCDPSPCGQNTNCRVVSAGNAVCNCLPTYIPRPDIIDGCVNPCIPNPCGHGAECRPGTRDFFCQCPAGFLGDPYTLCRRALPPADGSCRTSKDPNALCTCANPVPKSISINPWLLAGGENPGVLCGAKTFCYVHHDADCFDKAMDASGRYCTSKNACQFKK